MEYIERFFAVNGSKCLLFYYEEKSQGEGGKEICWNLSPCSIIVVLDYIWFSGPSFNKM